MDYYEITEQWLEHGTRPLAIQQQRLRQDITIGVAGPR